MALPWRSPALVIALLVALAAVAVNYMSRGMSRRLDPRCSWGSPVVLKSASGMNLEAVGQGVALKPPAGGEGQLWRIVMGGETGETVRLSGAGGKLQDVEGRVGLDIEPGRESDLWWVMDIAGGAVRLLSKRQMYLAFSGGAPVMTGKMEEAEAFQVLLPDGQQGFEQWCWPKKTRDTALNDGWLSPTQQTPAQVPQPSHLANYSWKPFYKVTDEDLRFYDEHGWVLLKQAVEPEIMDILYNEAETFCKAQIAHRNVCQIEMLRWQLNTFRDFIFYGPLGSIVHSFVRGSGVRVSTEALFGTVYNKVDPPFFSYQYHTDAGNQEGVFHGFGSGTPAAAAWFPLHDVDAEVTGGGIKVVDGYPASACKWKNCGGMLTALGPGGPKQYDCPSYCLERFGWWDCASNGCKNSNAQQILSFKKGDIVVWHSDMPHATQSTKQLGFSRYSFTVRFVDSDAVMCDVAGSCGGWMACCKDSLRVSGQKIHNYCYPQIFPEVLDHEVKAHHSSTPKHVIADQAIENMIHGIPRSKDCEKSPGAM